MVNLLRFRAWIKEEKCFADFIETIRYYSKEIDLCWGGICESDCFDFEDVILMQSTGLFDKNGKEIFEGDILKVANNDSSWFEVVKYDHNKAMFISKEMNLKYEVPETPLYDLFSPYLFKVEVIGNILGDGDLIDGKKANEN